MHLCQGGGDAKPVKTDQNLPPGQKGFKKVSVPGTFVTFIAWGWFNMCLREACKITHNYDMQGILEKMLSRFAIYFTEYPLMICVWPHTASDEL